MMVIFLYWNIKPYNLIQLIFFNHQSFLPMNTLAITTSVHVTIRAETQLDSSVEKNEHYFKVILQVRC